MYPTGALAASALTDSAGGTVSSTIDAAGGLYSQSAENKERSSMADAYNDLRTLARAAIGSRGGGYRPVTPPVSLTVNPSSSGSTISAASAIHVAAEENDYRGNLGAAINALLTDITNAKGLTGPRGSFTHLTDNSGGTPSDTIVSAGAGYLQSGENNNRASFATKLNAIATAMGV